MKRFLTILILAVLCSLPNLTSAQKAKFGHCDYNAIMQAIPGYDTIQTAAMALKDELEKDYNAMAEEFQVKYEDYQAKAATYSAAVNKVKQQELTDLQTRLQKFQEDAQQQIQALLLERSKPFDEKTKAAIKEVAKAGGYTYIFDKNIPLFSGDSSDITDLVKQKLGIK